MSINKLVINRSLWGQGALLNTDGTMCCLGFLSLACGVPKSLLRKETPGRRSSSITFPDRSWVEQYNLPLWSTRSPAGRVAALINDSVILTSSEKELKLIDLFRNQGIKLSFED